jgi:tetratricopeptide (TPR) repeat protein
MIRTPFESAACAALALLAVAQAAPAGREQGPAPAGGSASPSHRDPKAEIELARALQRRGLSFSAFFHYARIVEAGPNQPDFLEAVQGTAATGEALGDQVFAPNILRKAYGDSFARLPPDARSQIDYAVALLAYRAGELAEAAQRLHGVVPGSAPFARALLLQGLLAQRGQPEKAIEILRGVLRLSDEGTYRDLLRLREIAHLNLGRTLYGLHRYAEASAEYAAVPRFSRHWDEALFEGAYSDLKSGDKGSALGRLHGLHSPHLSDEFAPESENLAAAIYFGNCLYPQVREAVKRFEARYLPMRDQVKALLDPDPPLLAWVALLRGTPGLPSPVLRHLLKNERIDSMLGYLARLDDEASRVESAGDLPQGVERSDLREILASQRALAVQVAGKFIRGRVLDLAHLIDVLDREKEIIAFETAKGEKALLDGNVDVRETLARQRLLRPEMPTTGHEYWPFDGEYWPDEIGYYRYTLKNACPATPKDDSR